MKRVAFVCIGNACRSQMAEGFARTYGSDVMEPHSGGLFPIDSIPEETARAMAEKNIDISSQFPKPFSSYPIPYFDLVINMSGQRLFGISNVRAWRVDDPYGLSERKYQTVRDQIETLVMNLVLELRREQRQK